MSSEQAMEVKYFFWDFKIFLNSVQQGRVSMEFDLLSFYIIAAFWPFTLPFEAEFPELPF